jgi:hypothetical protein
MNVVAGIPFDYSCFTSSATNNPGGEHRLDNCENLTQSNFILNHDYSMNVFRFKYSWFGSKAAGSGESGWCGLAHLIQ